MNSAKFQEIPNDFKFKVFKLMVVVLDPIWAIIFVGAALTKDCRSKKLLSCNFCDTEGTKNIKFVIVVTYMILRLFKNNRKNLKFQTVK